MLKVESVQEALDITAQAISDKVIDAHINYELKQLISSWSPDLYSSTEPSKQLHKRIAFCLQLYTDAVKSMDYPENVKSLQNKELEDAAEEMKRNMKDDIDAAGATNSGNGGGNSSGDDEEDDGDMM